MGGRGSYATRIKRERKERTIIRRRERREEEGKEKVILFNFSGHGLMDLVGYNKYLNGELNDYEYPEEEIAKNLKKLEGYPLPK